MRQELNKGEIKMPDWHGKDDDDIDEGNSNRRQRGRRGHGRGSRDFGDSPEFGGSDDFGAPPIYTGDFGRTQDFNSGHRAESRTGAGGDFRPRSPAPSARPGDDPASQAERGPRQSGTVKFFKGDKGFGFITPDSGETDVFVHISAVERSGLTGLDSGQRISFETEPDRRGKGPKAVELQVEEGEQA